MGKLVTDLGMRIAQRVLEGEYPTVRDKVMMKINNLAIHLINTAQGLVKRMADEGIVMDMDIKREALPDGARICMEFRIKALDPVKLDMLRMVAMKSIDKTVYKQIIMSGALNDLIKEVLAELVVGELEKSAWRSGNQEGGQERKKESSSGKEEQGQRTTA